MFPVNFSLCFHYSSTLSPQLSTVIMPPLANLAKLLHRQDFRDGL